MRIHAGSNMIRCLLVVVLATSWAAAQDPGGQWGGPLAQAESFAPPVGNGSGATYGPYGQYPPEAAFAGPPGGVVPGAGESYPWPEVSPFDHRFDQVVQEEGLWTRFINDSPRKFSAGIDWMHIWYKKPGGAGNEPDKQIGFPVRLGTTVTETPLLDEWQDTPTNFIYDPIMPIVEPDRIYRWSAIEDDLDATGFQGFYSWEDPDETGAEIQGFYGGKEHQEVDFPFQPRRRDSLIFADRSAVINRVKTFDGTLSEVPLLFVTSLTATYDAQAWGAEANMITMPLLGRDSNRIRGYYGLRYLGVHERFDVVGVDERPDVFPLTNREFSAVFSGFGGNYGGTTFIRTSVDSQLVGPQLGLRWDLGGDKFKLKSWIVGGPLANFNKTRIFVQNYGAVPGPGLNATIDEKHSSLSPLLELGIQGDMPLFGYIPLVNRIPVVRDGILRVGYRYTNVFLMDRPVDSITYGDPLPVIDSDPESWTVRSVNVGIRWDW